MLPPHPPEHPVEPRPSPKICWFRLCHLIPQDQARRGNRGGCSPKHLGCATSGASRDAHSWSSHSWMFSQLEVVPGKGQAQTSPCLSWESLPSSSCTDSCHPTLPPSGVSTSKHPKNQQKGSKEASRPPPKTQPAQICTPLCSTSPEFKKKKI